MKIKERVFMFVWSIRASTLKFFMAVAASAMILCLLVVMIPAPASTAIAPSDEITSGEVEFRAEDKDDRVRFLQGYGWAVDSGSEIENEVTLPMEFDRVFAGYNEIQRAQGMDLAPYKGKDVMSYTYTVTNYEDYDGKVFANVLVYKGRVIGGDICSADTSGFIHGFEKDSR